jgi:hypothetical protein
MAKTKTAFYFMKAIMIIEFLSPHVNVFPTSLNVLLPSKRIYKRLEQSQSE